MLLNALVRNNILFQQESGKKESTKNRSPLPALLYVSCATLSGLRFLRGVLNGARGLFVARKGFCVCGGFTILYLSLYSHEKFRVPGIMNVQRGNAPALVLVHGLTGRSTFSTYPVPDCSGGYNA